MILFYFKSKAYKVNIMIFFPLSLYKKFQIIYSHQGIFANGYFKLIKKSKYITLLNKNDF